MESFMYRNDQNKDFMLMQKCMCAYVREESIFHGIVLFSIIKTSFIYYTIPQLLYCSTTHMLAYYKYKFDLLKASTSSVKFFSTH